MKEFEKIIKNGDLELRQLEPTFANAKMLFDAVNESRERLRPWLGWEKFVQRPEDEYSHLLESEKDEKVFCYAVFNQNVFCGMIDIHSLSKLNKTGEVGIWLHNSAAGQGIALRALKMLEDEFFSGDALNKIIYLCDNLNSNSANVALRSGYKLEVVLREAEFCEVDSTFHDLKYFSKLKSEWEKGIK